MKITKDMQLRCIGIVDNIADSKLRKLISTGTKPSFVIRIEQTLEPVVLNEDSLKGYIKNGYRFINLYISSDDVLRCRDCALDKLPTYHVSQNASGEYSMPVRSGNTYLLVDRDKANNTYTIIDNNFTNITIHASKLIKMLQGNSINLCNAVLRNNSFTVRCVGTLISSISPTNVYKPSTHIRPAIPNSTYRTLQAMNEGFKYYGLSLKDVYTSVIPEYTGTSNSVAARLKAAGIVQRSKSNTMETLHACAKFDSLYNSLFREFRDYVTMKLLKPMSLLIGQPVLFLGIDSATKPPNGQTFELTFNVNANGPDSSREPFYISINVDPSYTPHVSGISGSPAILNRLLPSYLTCSDLEEEPLEYLIKKTENLPAWITYLYNYCFNMGHKVQVANGAIPKTVTLGGFASMLVINPAFSCSRIPNNIVSRYSSVHEVADLAVKSRNVVEKWYTKSGYSYEELSTNVYTLGTNVPESLAYENGTYYAIATSYIIDDHAKGLVITLVCTENNKLWVLDAYGFIQTDEDEYSSEYGSIFGLKNGQVHDDTYGFVALARYYKSLM